MSVGLALAGNRVEVVLPPGAAEALLEGPVAEAAVSRRAGEFLDALRELGGEVRRGNVGLTECREADLVVRWGA